MRDIFEPSRDPAKSIYLAFQEEAKKRKARSVEEWTAGERDAVHHECARQAQVLGLQALTIEQVVSAERYAVGSIDYGAKWAHQLARVMTPAASTVN